jgi:hypothetical protein
MYEMSCTYCGEAFVSRRWDARFCRPRCVSANWRRERDERVQRLEGLLRKFTEAVGAGADETVLRELSRSARTLFASNR